MGLRFDGAAKDVVDTPALISGADRRWPPVWMGSYAPLRIAAHILVEEVVTCGYSRSPRCGTGNCPSGHPLARIRARLNGGACDMRRSVILYGTQETSDVPHLKASNPGTAPRRPLFADLEDRYGNGEDHSSPSRMVATGRTVRTGPPIGWLNSSAYTAGISLPASTGCSPKPRPCTMPRRPAWSAPTRSRSIPCTVRLGRDRHSASPSAHVRSQVRTTSAPSVGAESRHRDAVDGDGLNLFRAELDAAGVRSRPCPRPTE